jgi:hypothetical protein
VDSFSAVQRGAVWNKRVLGSLKFLMALARGLEIPGSALTEEAGSHVKSNDSIGGGPD